MSCFLKLVKKKNKELAYIVIMLFLLSVLLLICCAGCGQSAVQAQETDDASADIQEDVPDQTDSAEHDLVYVEGIAATCEESGVSEYWQCRDCGKIFSDEKGTEEIGEEDIIIQALGHDWGEWEITKPAQFNENGEARRVCLRDGSHVDIMKIEAIPFEYEEGPDGSIVYYAEVEENTPLIVSNLISEAKFDNASIEFKTGFSKVVFDAETTGSLSEDNAIMSFSVVTDDSRLPYAEVTVYVNITGQTLENAKMDFIVAPEKPIPETTNVRVYKTDENGNRTDIDAVVINEYVRFSAAEFGTYIVVYEDNAE